MLKLEKLIHYTKHIKDKLHFVLIFYFFTIFAFAINGVILHIRLFLIQQNLIVDSKNRELQIELIEILDLMLITGQIFRACGPVGIAFSSIIAAAVLVYCLPNLISQFNVFDHYRNNRPLDYLIAPEVECERISSRIDKILENIIESNLNIKALVLGQYEGELVENKLKNYNYRRKYSILDLSNELQVISQAMIYKINRCSLKLKQNNNHCSVARILFLANLQEQLRYLTRLKSEKERIWPTNRNPQWAETIKLIWRIGHMTWSIVVWLFGAFITSTAIESSFNSLEKSELGAKYQRITFLDRLVASNLHMLSYGCILMAVVPISVLSICLIDIFKHFLFLRDKVDELGYKLNKLYKSRDRLHSRYSVVENFDHTKRDLHLECDKSAIELYICYVIFRYELKDCIGVAERAATQIVLFMVLIIVPIFPFMKLIMAGGDSVILLTIFVASLLVAVDYTLVMCAAVYAYCMKHTKKIWYFIAYAERYNMEAYYPLRSFKINDDRKFQDNSTDNFFDKDKTAIQNLDFDYHLHSFLTFHTLFLWRRLAMNEEIVPNNFICKLFGTFEVSYGSILKYNYWIVSIALVILTN